jgi:hypothetical protein
MTSLDLKHRVVTLASSVVTLCGELRKGPEARTVADRLSDAAAAMAAHYAASGRARSARELASRLTRAALQAEHMVGWLDVLLAGRLAPEDTVSPLWFEGQDVVVLLNAAVSMAEQGQAEELTGLARGAGPGRPEGPRS